MLFQTFPRYTQGSVDRAGIDAKMTTENIYIYIFYQIYTSKGEKLA